MENNKKICNCWAACFDLLGVRDKLKNISNTNTLDEYVIKFKNILKTAKKDVKQHQGLLSTIQYGFYSDTVFFYTPIDKTGHSYTVIDSLARHFFLQCIKTRKPLCGALSLGLLYANKEENIYIGPSLLDAYEYTKKQDWIGLVITPNARCKLKEYNDKPLQHLEYTEYDVPIKTKDNHSIIQTTKKLSAFKMQNYKPTVQCIQKMKREAINSECGEDIIKKYDNTLQFINSKKSETRD